MGLILSHETARSYHALPGPPTELPRLPARTSELRESAPTKLGLRDALVALEALDLSTEDPIHTLVSQPGNRRKLEGLICHVHSAAVPARSLLQLGSSLYVCDIRLCALQAATYLRELELIEYLYQICGAYETPLASAGELVERVPLTSVEELRRMVERSERARGALALKQALPYVRNGTRSPMETAFVMMLALPKRLGGMGIRSLKVNYRVEVPQTARPLTRRRYFYFDAYLPSSKTDIEYNGFYHNEDVQRAIDEERHNALSTMGYQVLDISKHSLMDRASFTRFVRKLMRLADIRANRLPSNFFETQERLRQFVLRRRL